jgi:hypothetical protein
MGPVPDEPGVGGPPHAASRPRSGSVHVGPDHRVRGGDPHRPDGRARSRLGTGPRRFPDRLSRVRTHQDSPRNRSLPAPGRPRGRERQSGGRARPTARVRSPDPPRSSTHYGKGTDLPDVRETRSFTRSDARVSVSDVSSPLAPRSPGGDRTTPARAAPDLRSDPFGPPPSASADGGNVGRSGFLDSPELLRDARGISWGRRPLVTRPDSDGRRRHPTVGGVPVAAVGEVGRW